MVFFSFAAKKQKLAETSYLHRFTVFLDVLQRLIILVCFIVLPISECEGMYIINWPENSDGQTSKGSQA